jgi:hypothetical protein
LRNNYLGSPIPSGFFERPETTVSKLTQNQIMSTTKNQVQSLLQQLPDDCSIEDIQYHLYVIEKVRRGLEIADKEGTISQVAVEERLSKWL